MSHTEVTSAAKQPVSRGFIARYGLMYLGQNIAWAAPSTLLLANQILIWFPQSKETMLAWLMSVGGVMSLIANPASGVLSDATRSRFGRRAPWVFSGAVVAAAALLVAAFAGTFGVPQAGLGFGILVAAWIVFQFSLALSITPAQSIAPDRVPQQQFGVVSGVMGVTTTVAIVLGTAVAAALDAWLAYLVVVAALLGCMLPFLLIDREPPTIQSIGPKPRIKFTLPRSTDFWWMFVTRILLTLAQAIALFYLLYFLRDRVHYADPDAGVLTLTLVFAICVVTTAALSGWASDKVGRRKPFVFFAALGVAASCLLFAFADTFGLVVVGAAILGFSWGVYQAIDQAIVNQVLPNEAERATHMGVMNLAVGLPNTLAGLVAAAAIVGLGGYAGLYTLAAGMAIVGGFMVLRIRSIT